MEKHIKVARAHRAISWLYAFCTLVFFGMFIIMGKSTTVAHVFFFYFLVAYLPCITTLREELSAKNRGHEIHLEVLLY